MLLPLRLLDGPEVIKVEVLADQPVPEYYTSTIVNCQLPDFVSLDHGTFVTFLESYYEWMERGVTHGSTGAGEINVSQHLTDYRDADESIDYFFDNMKKDYMGIIPKVLSDGINERNVLKNIKQFYASKGTVNSVKFLLRMVYNEYAEVYEPKKHIMKASGGEYNVGERLLVSSSHGASIYECSGKIVSQFDPLDPSIRTASAGVEDVVRFVGEGYDFYSLYVVSPSGTFKEDIPLSIPITSQTITESVVPVIDSLAVSAGGSYYAVGDKVTITTDRGRGGRAFVSNVGDDGTISSVDILDRGINFKSNDNNHTVSITSTNGTGAELTVTGGSIVHNTAGYYITDSGLLSSTNKMQDNEYYQDYSYVIRSAMHFAKYRDVIKKVIHPAGYAVFGDLLLFKNLISDLTSSGQTFGIETPIIGHYTPYTLSTYENLRANSASTDLFPVGFSGDLEPGFNESGGVTHVLGASGPLGDGDNPGGSANQPNYNQKVQISGTDSITAGYWLVYKHPNVKTISGSSYGGGNTHGAYPLYDVVSGANPVGTFSIGDYVYQRMGVHLPEAQGVVVGTRTFGSDSLQVLTVETYTDQPFSVSGINTGVGSTSGLLIHAGASGSTMMHINEVQNLGQRSTRVDGATNDWKTLNIKGFSRRLTF